MVKLDLNRKMQRIMSRYLKFRACSPRWYNSALAGRAIFYSLERPNCVVDAMTVLPFECEVCGEIFETLEVLQVHERGSRARNGSCIVTNTSCDCQMEIQPDKYL